MSLGATRASNQEAFSTWRIEKGECHWGTEASRCNLRRVRSATAVIVAFKKPQQTHHPPASVGDVEKDG